VAVLGALKQRGVLHPHTRAFSGVILTADNTPVFARYLALEPFPITGRVCPDECYDRETGACKPWYDPEAAATAATAAATTAAAAAPPPLAVCRVCALFEESACAGESALYV
jgi:hypothetical protein